VKLRNIAISVLVVVACAQAQSVGRQDQPELLFESSDSRLVAAFDWAKHQAMAYVFSGDPVGPWYEAALPGREAFCMRDVSHQCLGAQALGLCRSTHSMLRRFAEDISDSKDWCSYWEIDRYNHPAPVDYRNDAEFWYDLPANFDVLGACYRMYLWTGDLTYLDDPAFLNFYDRTVSDYVKRWSLGLNQVMTRKRWMNVRGEFDPRDNFQVSRGIPGYEEGAADCVMGVDLLATQYAAYRAYAAIQALRGNFEAAQSYAARAASVKDFINSRWWDDHAHHFYAILDQNYHLQGHAGTDLLYYGAADDGPKTQAALNDLLAAIRSNPSGQVELESHYAEILYRYGVPDVAYSQIMDLTHKGRYRQEYPEVSYSVVGAIVTGLMGINIEKPSPAQSALQWNFLQSADSTREALLQGPAPPVQWNYVEAVVKTLPRLSDQTTWAEVRNLPVRDNEISVRHEGLRKTIFTNESGPALIWQATFPGSHRTLLVNGRGVKAEAGKEPLSHVTSWVQVPVGAGDTVTVQVM
jgi:hypothetical protein